MMFVILLWFGGKIAWWYKYSWNPPEFVLNYCIFHLSLISGTPGVSFWTHVLLFPFCVLEVLCLFPSVFKAVAYLFFVLFCFY